MALLRLGIVCALGGVGLVLATSGLEGGERPGFKVRSPDVAKEYNQAAGAEEEDQQVVSSKATHLPAAGLVNFRSELKLNYPSLYTLGGRIDTARHFSDPVALAYAASELAVAEKVSGKEASLTSNTLIKESAELAQLRRQASELRAVEQVAQNISAEKNLIANIRRGIAVADAEAKADTQAYRQNQEPTWTPRKLVINNHTSQLLAIWVDGNARGEVGPGLTRLVILEHRWNPTVVTLFSEEGFDKWGPRYIRGQFKTYTWNVN
jgi:hypothetical protein